jgi:hypothetical protein
LVLVVLLVATKLKVLMVALQHFLQTVHQVAVQEDRRLAIQIQVEILGVQVVAQRTLGVQHLVLVTQVLILQ